MVLGKVKSLIISFDCFNDSNVFVYFSGDIVLGRVNLEVIGEIRVKFFKIYVRGYVKVCWIEFRNVGFNIVYIQNYIEEVEYFNYKDILIGYERDDDNFEEGFYIIYLGRYEYVFSFEFLQILFVILFEG